MIHGSTQTERLWNLLSDHKPHRTDQILKLVYGNKKLGIARISARVYDIKRMFNKEIESYKDPVKQTLWWYRLTGKKYEV